MSQTNKTNRFLFVYRSETLGVPLHLLRFFPYLLAGRGEGIKRAKSRNDSIVPIDDKKGKEKK